MRYPYCLFREGLQLRPIFDLRGTPCLIDLSETSRHRPHMDASEPRTLQKAIAADMRGRCDWALGAYLERRATLLQDCPQMVAEERYYHLGLDIIVPVHTELHAPLEATVEETGYEAGEGNYGGYVLLKHRVAGSRTFYSFYGHLETDSLPETGLELPAGAVFARIGDFHENGNWFHHTHLQILTEEGLRQGFKLKGYASAADLALIHEYCPDPVPLLKVR